MTAPARKVHVLLSVMWLVGPIVSLTAVDFLGTAVTRYMNRKNRRDPEQPSLLKTIPDVCKSESRVIHYVRRNEPGTAWSHLYVES